MSSAEFEMELNIACFANRNNGIKSIEYAIQDVIEKKHPGKAWWEVCSFSIFMKLYEGMSVDELIKEVVEAC